MPKLEWDAVGEHFYETGVDHGVLYVFDKKNRTYKTGVAWNGLISVTESPSGAEETALYADNQKYLSLMSAEDYKYTIKAYQSPKEFDECDGTVELVPGIHIGQQTRSSFGFVYRTKKGNDTDSDDFGYKIHIAYGGKAAPSEREYNTINNDPETIELSWEISTTPVPVTGHKPTAAVTIDSTTVDAAKLAILEGKLFGTDTTEPTLLTPDEIIAIFLGE